MLLTILENFSIKNLDLANLWKFSPFKNNLLYGKYRDVQIHTGTQAYIKS